MYPTGHSSKFRASSRVRKAPEEGRRIYRPKHSGNNNKDEDNSPKILNDKDISICLFVCLCFMAYTLFFDYLKLNTFLDT